MLSAGRSRAIEDVSGGAWLSELGCTDGPAVTLACMLMQGLAVRLFLRVGSVFRNGVSRFGRVSIHAAINAETKKPAWRTMRACVSVIWSRLTRRKPGRPMPLPTNARTLPQYFARNKWFFYSLFLSIVRPEFTRSANPCLLTASRFAIATGLPACT